MIVATSQDAAALFEPCFEAADAGAVIAVAYLDAGRRLIELSVMPPEPADHVDLPVRRIVEDALRLGAAGLLVAHNHPHGDAQPSWEDVESARELAETAARLGIRLRDHLIFAGGGVCSLRTLGLL
jgi:DNA repair protein RadC